jgi:hypothetical protein
MLLFWPLGCHSPGARRAPLDTNGKPSARPAVRRE